MLIHRKLLVFNRIYVCEGGKSPLKTFVYNLSKAGQVSSVLDFFMPLRKHNQLNTNKPIHQQMNDNSKKRKALALSLALAAMMLGPVAASAQDGGNRGLLGKGQEAAEDGNSRGMLNGSSGGYSLFNQQFGSGQNGGYELHNQTFGQETPLGSGLFILAAAGAGYALKKRKSNKKH